MTSNARLGRKLAARSVVRADDDASAELAARREPAGGAPPLETAVLDLQAAAGNSAVAHLVRAPAIHRGLAVPTIQRADDEGAGGTKASPASGGSAGGASSTTIGPPSNSTYDVSGSLQDVANTISARTEAGAETSSPSMDTVTDDGRITSVTVTVAQSVQLPNWTDKASGTATQQAEWNRFLSALSTHEDGHVAKDVAAWTGAHTKIVGKSEEDGSAAFDAIANASNQANTDYDTANDHGLKQGTGIDPNV